MTPTAPPAADLADFPTKGRVAPAADGVVILRPTGTNYELHLKHAAAVAADRPTLGLVRAKARKLYTVESGGNFIAPILGTPRIVQGRVRRLTATHAVVQAGANVVVELPTADDAFDLAAGPVEVGRMINVTLMPGAWYEPLPPSPSATAAAQAVVGERHDPEPTEGKR